VILTEEGVFEKEFSAHFIEAVRLRKKLAHEYLLLTAEDVHGAVQAFADDYGTLHDSIARYVNL
jgi:uncharacterized protein YutE (UPF0331/DUF86 family)